MTSVFLAAVPTRALQSVQSCTETEVMSRFVPWKQKGLRSWVPKESHSQRMQLIKINTNQQTPAIGRKQRRAWQPQGIPVRDFHIYPCCSWRSFGRGTDAQWGSDSTTPGVWAQGMAFVYNSTSQCQCM